jgi:hypothetical protein
VNISDGEHALNDIYEGNLSSVMRHWLFRNHQVY